MYIVFLIIAVTSSYLTLGASAPEQAANLWAVYALVVLALALIAAGRELAECKKERNHEHSVRRRQ